jgi:hypothetical protein
MQLPPRLNDWLGHKLINRSLLTPYVDIPGYQERNWVIPYAHRSNYDVADGTGPVCWWRRPIARVLQLCDVACRTHHILRSDDARVVHDHPWSWFISIILRGGYWEITPIFDKSGLYLGEKSEWIGQGRVIFRCGSAYHRLELRPGETTWTLFFTGKYVRKWGFLVEPRHKMSYTDYAKMFGPKDSPNDRVATPHVGRSR